MPGLEDGRVSLQVIYVIKWMQLRLGNRGRTGFTAPRQMGGWVRGCGDLPPTAVLSSELLKTLGQIQQMGAPLAAEQFDSPC